MAVVVAGCTLCGKSFASAAERRCRLLFELLNALRLLRVGIVRYSEPLKNALRNSGSPLFARTAEALDASESIFDAWQSVKMRSMAHGCECDCLSAKELSALDRLFERLGESGRLSQDENVCACIAAIELIHEEARAQASIYGRLYTSVGFLTGLAIAVLIV